MARLLIVDDERTAALTLASLFKRSGHETRTAYDGVEALAALEQAPVDVLITDLKMPNLDGMGLLAAVKQRWPDTAVLVVTAFGSVDTAVEAMRLGAIDFATKPVNVEALRLKVDKAVQQSEMAREVARLNARLADYEAHGAPGGIVGRSAALQKVFGALGKVAPTDSSVLILGESGTGKELLARAIHERSARASGPFVQVHCAAYAEGVLESELFGHERGAFTGAAARKLGRFELASGGTFFLDEVGDIPLPTQIKLLRVLEERRFERVGGTREVEVDIRLVAATHRRLTEAIAAGRFREDLYYRLNGFTIELPPLRERADDIPLLVEAFVERESRRLGRSIGAPDAAAMAALQGWRWPGNIRELRNVIERAAVLAGPEGIRAEHLPETLGAPQRAPAAIPEEGLDFDVALANFERGLILQAYEQAGRVKAKAARLLGIDRNRLRYKLEKLGIED